ncbi:MAG: ABC transporter ATP-binding protein [Kiritimatiellae bacterium]|nr:ABC transporter ATP-binding protein [Kiritimatiellia bacterium]
MLTVDHLSFSYGRNTVLRDVSFQFETGEIIGLLGKNGTGKTTLLKILATSLMQDRGSIELDQVDPLATPIRYRTRIGYLPEKCPLYPEMTVKEYLAYRDRLKREKTLRVNRRVREVMANCDLTEVARKRIKTLSLGFQKRVAIADALLRKPSVLLLDDLLPGLDVAQRAQIIDLLRGTAARSAILIAGHEISELITFCTRFLVLSEGVIALDIPVKGTSPDELKTRLEKAICGKSETA